MSADPELLAIQAYDDGIITQVIRPAAVIPENAVRAILVELSLRDVRAGGHWSATPTMWQRYDRGWQAGADEPGNALLVGSLQVAYSTPTRYEITIYRATVTMTGTEQGWTTELLCDEALGFGGLTLARCPRADLKPPPKPFRF